MNKPYRSVMNELFVRNMVNNNALVKFNYKGMVYFGFISVQNHYPYKCFILYDNRLFETVCSFMSYILGSPGRPDLFNSVFIETVNGFVPYNSFPRRLQKYRKDDLILKLNSKFLKHITYPNNSEIQVKTKFVKTWLISNNGLDSWTKGMKIKFLYQQDTNISGITIIEPQHFVLDSDVSPGEEINISVELQAPAEPGLCSACWVLSDHNKRFGSKLWLKVKFV